MGRHPLDAAIADVAATRYGLIGRSDLVRLEATEAAVRWRRRTGRLEELSPLVYRLPGVPRSPRHDLLAAAIDGGEGAVATRRSAAALWGLPGFPWPRPPEVLVKRAGDHKSRLGLLSETSWLPPHHVTVHQSIPVVTLARLCFELAATENPKRTERAVDNALLAGMALDSLAEVVGSLAKRGRPGSTLMRELVGARGEGYIPPASELEALGLEALGLELLRRGGLPEPVRQFHAGGEALIGRIDCAYPEARLVIEFDGRRHWQVLLEAQADRKRDAELVAAGWRVLRITWDMLVHDPEGVIRLVRDALRHA